MAKVDAGNLTLDESKELFTDLLALLPESETIALIVEHFDKAMLEELEVACQDRMREIDEDEDENEK